MKDRDIRNGDRDNTFEGNQGRARFYAFFSRLTRQEVDSECLQALRSIQPVIKTAASVLQETWLGEGSEILRQFMQQVEDLDRQQRDQFLLELSGEYADLFILSGTLAIKPYESIYSSKDGLLMQEARDRVIAVYRRVGMLPVNVYREPEDNLAIELDFMAKLCLLGDNDREQVRFLKDHILSWVPKLCGKLSKGARSPLYKALAQLLAGFLTMEESFFTEGNKVPQEQFTWRQTLALIANLPNWHYFLEGKPLFGKPSDPRELQPLEERVIPSGCSLDCGARCPLKVYVKDGRIIKIMPSEPELIELRPCMRGLLYHYYVYSPDRLKYPLRRIGERGEGKFIRISWDEALDTVAKEIVRVRDTYGPAAIINSSYSGGSCRLHGARAIYRLLNMAGGHTQKWGTASCEGSMFASMATYGTFRTGSEPDDLLNAKMVILWGTNPAESLFGNATRRYLMLAKENGTDIVCIDPRYTDTAASFASQWIPIRPGTDTAMLVAMAYVIIRKRLHNQEFLNAYTVGFDKYKDYVMGIEDGIPKTPSWAAEITCVPAATIENLALRYARAKPAALIAGWGPGRSAWGEQYHRAASTLAILTGNVGIHGGNAAGMDWSSFDPTAMVPPQRLPVADNPVECGAPVRRDALVRSDQAPNTSNVNWTLFWDAILKGKEGGYPSDIKLLYEICGNSLNQRPDTNSAVRALQSLEFIVVHEQVMTPTAKFADILLPACTWCERWDFNYPWRVGKHVTYVNKAIEPMYESKSDFEVCTELAQRLGISGYNDKTDDEWLRFFHERENLPDYSTLKEKGLYAFNLTEPHVAFRAQIEDPEHNKFPTPSGKIEIYSQRIADIGNTDFLPAIPKYLETWEGVNDPLREKYPLQLITTHSRKRVHSSLDSVEWLRDVEPHVVWINPVDAKSRGITDGDQVKVFNARGTVLIPAKVTSRIMPGVVCIYEGAWYSPDALGVDHRGCPNVLTKAGHSPGGAFCANTSLVEVVRS